MKSGALVLGVIALAVVLGLGFQEKAFFEAAPGSQTAPEIKF